MTLLDVFSTNDWDIVAQELRRRYIDNATEKDRVKRAHERKLLSRDAGTSLVEELIEKQFKDSVVKAQRKAAVPFTGYDNAVKRIASELATVYRRPAKREVQGKDNNETYQELLRRTRHNQMMKRTDVDLHLFRNVWLGFRVRDEGEVRGSVPVTEVVTPDCFHVIASPRDATHLVGIIIDQKQPGAPEGSPRWLVWTDTEVFYMDTGMRFMKATLEANSYGRLPGVLCSAAPPDGRLLDDTTGEDIKAAALAAWFFNVLQFKEAKSITKSVVWSGDLSTTPTGQMQDTEADNIAGEGVGIQSVDRGVDLDQFRRASDSVIERAAANYGLSPALLRQVAATSGNELDLRRAPLEENRVEMIQVFRDIEREFTEVQSLVLATDNHPMRFDPKGWKIDFAEVDRHMTDKDRFELRKTKRSMGHSNAFSEAIEDNPDLKADEAKKWVLENLGAHADFVQLARALNMSPKANADDPGQSPQQNGAQGPQAQEAEEQTQ